MTTPSPSERAHGGESSAEAVLLDALRSRAADTTWTNYDNEEVWLRPVYIDGKQVGITDCCLTEAPCDRHRPVPVRDSWGACRHGNGFPCPICMGVRAGARR